MRVLWLPLLTFLSLLVEVQLLLAVFVVLQAMPGWLLLFVVPAVVAVEAAVAAAAAGLVSAFRLPAVHITLVASVVATTRAVTLPAPACGVEQLPVVVQLLLLALVSLVLLVAAAVVCGGWLMLLLLLLLPDAGSEVSTTLRMAAAATAVVGAVPLQAVVVPDGG